MPLFQDKLQEDGSRLVIWDLKEEPAWFLDKLNLNPADLTSYLSIGNDVRKIEWLAVRYMIFLTTGYCCIQYAPSGQPILFQSKYNISVSHSKDYAGILISEKSQNGLDIEQILPRILRIRDRFLNKDELKLLGDKCDLSDFYKFWCGKEALVKATTQRNLDFKKEICISSFDKGEKGKIFASVSTANFKSDYCLSFFTINQNMVVWLTKDQPI